MRRPLNSFIRITSVHGQITNMGFFGKHLGVDYSVAEGNPVFAPVSGKVTQSSSSTSAGNFIELTEAGNGRIHRIMHLKTRGVATGATVSEGQQIGLSGNTGLTTGPHVHWDIRKAGTTWNSSFWNYYNPEQLIAQSQPPKPTGMPAVNSKIKLLSPDNRSTFRAGTITKAGNIAVTNDTDFVYTVRGYDPKFPYRIIINSRSAGGDGVALALYYTNGTKIPKWVQL